MMEIYTSYLIFIICAISFIVSYVVLYQVKNSPRTPNRFFLIFSALYAFMATNIIVILLLIIHLNSGLWFLFHFHSLMNNSHQIIFTIHHVQVDFLSVLIISLYPIVLFLLFIISQSSLFVLSKWVNENIEISYLSRIEKIVNSNTWLEKVSIKIITENIPDAFAYSLFKIGWTHIKFEKVIILTTSLIDLISDDDELEAIIAHEYAHTKEHHTLFANLFVFISILFFFVPLFKLSKGILWQNSEIKADKYATSLISDPLPLARALYKLFLLTDSNPTSNSGITPLTNGNGKLIINRINLLIGYSEEMTIEM